MVVLANRCESAKRKANRGHYFHYIEGFKLPELYIGRSPQFLQIDNRRNPIKLRRLSILASGQISVIRTPFYSYDIKLCRFDRSLGSYIRPKASVYNVYRTKYSYQIHTHFDSGAFAILQSQTSRGDAHPYLGSSGRLS